ncbi:valine--pyruvate transaminase [Leptolyngbya cf. ectocarpi LEGE 11479]|uniref:Valine--pyruvate transaminase n=1 Tax=Leptolyngbya cf. ectocarpi LEGE 11479 TaxID=1828722 RepID=A0A928X0Y6_LEPEC|nr:valine--pyruvate transaminase [Leptolyngbya ectocarpi]MBE9067080.1 valine--pyruvate transaminase [Leptolyngbya cf. ectocarpi LEGE 11479]
MAPSLTQFGQQMSHLTGVRAIMKDIIETLQSGQSTDFINLSAGNPVILPAVEQLWRDCTAELLASTDYGEVVCRYGSSRGYEPLIDAIKNDFNQRYSLNLTTENILITPGSQALYFLAANAFGGYTSDNQLKEIVLPLSPDYTGYGGVSLYPEAVRAYRPTLEVDAANHRFKYRPDFSQLTITEQTGFVLFSRPCNPTGNVLTDDEVKRIAQLAADVPVFIDSAYAPPFPALNFTEMTPVLAPNVVHGISLSKAGLPGERVGIALGDAATIRVLESFQTNLCIHSSRYGQAIAARAIASGALARIAKTVIRPHYQQKFAVIESTLDEAMPDIPWYLHRAEGSIFAWLWLQDLPMDDQSFYQALKRYGVIVVPGNPFFPGLRDDWAHKHQCLRISLTDTAERLAIAIRRLATLAEQVYAQAKP